MTRKRRIRKKKKLNYFLTFTFIILLASMVLSFCGKKVMTETEDEVKQKYLSEFEGIATDIAKRYELFPSVVLAQSAHESNFGRSKLSSEFNNYFGIKANEGEEKVSLDTTEYIDGEATVENENFRKYSNPKESFKSYGELITKAERYKPVVEAKDYKEACIELQKNGYATDPDYASKLINIIEVYELYKLD